MFDVKGILLTFLTLPFCTNFHGVFCVFYDNYVRLCNSISKSPSAVAVELGLKKATVTRWKKGGNPTDANLQKIAVYFGVSTDYLLGKESEQKEKPAPEIGNGLSEKDMQLLAKIMALPDDKFEDVMDYMDYLISKQDK